MFFTKSKALIYILLLLIILSFIIPITSFAFDEDSIYVWSNNSSAVSTSISPSATEENADTSTQDDSRQFLKYYFWLVHINGSKNRKHSL